MAEVRRAAQAQARLLIAALEASLWIDFPHASIIARFHSKRLTGVRGRILTFESDVKFTRC